MLILKYFKYNILLFLKTLADNRLGETTQGTFEVCRMISENCILKKLNLSGNCFSDRDVESLTIALEVYFFMISCLKNY